jgi:hypothetical protein
MVPSDWIKCCESKVETKLGSFFFIFREENLQSKMLTNQDADWPRIRLPEEMCRRVCVGVCLVREKCDVILIIT